MIIDVGYWTRITKNILMLILSLVLIFLLFKLAIFYMPFLIGFVISLLVEPLIKRLSRRTKLERKKCAIMVIVIIFIIILALLVWGIVTLITESSNLLKGLNNYIQLMYDQVKNYIGSIKTGNTKLPMEVATILKEATENSLVILDEIGRGTSTYDGLSIAWAVAEYIANKEKCGAKTLFATHYHELIELADKQEGIKNYSIAVKEKGEDIIFLRKIVEGGTDESYGIHVARLAGVPKVVTKRADEILTSLERKSMLSGKKQEKESKKAVEGQFDMFNFKLAEIAHEIDKIDLNELTPIDALNTLVKIKEKMK